jgi:hypothetical protein
MLAVASLAAVTFAPFFLKNEHLFRPIVAHNLAANSGV